MIASVVATLRDDAGSLSKTLGEIGALPHIELGGYTAASRRIPIVIDSRDQAEMESTTLWLQERDGVVFVDVVFVHFDDPTDV